MWNSNAGTESQSPSYPARNLTRLNPKRRMGRGRLTECSASASALHNPNRAVISKTVHGRVRGTTYVADDVDQAKVDTVTRLWRGRGATCSSRTWNKTRAAAKMATSTPSAIWRRQAGPKGPRCQQGQDNTSRTSKTHPMPSCPLAPPHSTYPKGQVRALLVV